MKKKFYVPYNVYIIQEKVPETIRNSGAHIKEKSAEAAEKIKKKDLLRRRKKHDFAIPPINLPDEYIPEIHIIENGKKAGAKIGAGIHDGVSAVKDNVASKSGKAGRHGAKKRTGGKNTAAVVGMMIGAAALSAVFIRRHINLSKGSKDIWDGTASMNSLRYAANHRTFRTLTNMIRDELDPSMRVLNIACGSGDIARSTADVCGPVVACDFSENMISRAQKKGTPDNLMWDVQEPENLTYPANSFDAVIIANALNMFDMPELVLEQAARVLKPGGILIAPNYVRNGGFLEDTAHLFKTFMGHPDSIEWTFDEYKNFIVLNGWTILREDIIPGNNVEAFIVASKNV
ncbi:MAG: class I SAM-dependent methyltransferase [Anaerovoracaceae bacterium]|jgi:SAM-dependent methyltransferase